MQRNSEGQETGRRSAQKLHDEMREGREGEMLIGREGQEAPRRGRDELYEEVR